MPLLVSSGSCFSDINSGNHTFLPIFVMVFIFNKLLKSSSNIFLLVLLLFCIFFDFDYCSNVFLSDPSVLAWIGVGRDVSDDIRSEQVFSLLRTFERHFIMGTGFGASADEIRSESVPWSYEMSILALCMKIGLVGIFFFDYCISFIFCLTKKDHHLDDKVRADFRDTGRRTTVVVFYEIPILTCLACWVLDCFYLSTLNFVF